MSKISEENIIRILSRLDVPGNAAKIYIFLLKNGPSTGYSVSKKSGVNNAVVYIELERLKVRNLVYQLGIKPLKYEAISPYSFHVLGTLNSFPVSALYFFWYSGLSITSFLYFR